MLTKRLPATKAVDIPDMTRRRASPISRVQKLPREPLFDVHVWVDFVELLCLFSIDREVTKADVTAHYRRLSDLGDGPPLPSTEDPQTEIQSSLQSADSTERENGGEALEDIQPVMNAVEEGGPSEKSDRLELRVDDWFRHLPYRVRGFDAFYPFYLTKDHDVLKVRSRLTARQKLYVFFLVSSHLNFFAEYKTALTSSFEIVSLEAFKKLLPAGAEAHLFGSNPYYAKRYTGSLWKKINKLSNDIRGRVKVAQDRFSPNDTGDKGLDLVGWFPFEDENPNMVVLFGGCACSKEEWVQKQLSSSAVAWSGTIDLESLPLNVVFIPICFRRENGSWHKPQDIHQTILIDRIRFISLLKEYRLPWRHRSYRAVSEILNEREPLF